MPSLSERATCADTSLDRYSRSIASWVAPATSCSASEGGRGAKAARASARLAAAAASGLASPAATREHHLAPDSSMDARRPRERSRLAVEGAAAAGAAALADGGTSSVVRSWAPRLSASAVITLKGISTKAVASVFGEGRAAAEAAAEAAAGEGEGGAAGAFPPPSPGGARGSAGVAVAAAEETEAAEAALPSERLLPEYAAIRTLLPVKLVSIVTCTGRCEGPHSLE